MISRIISIISGLIFGFGLTFSNMINPAKVIGFLNLFGYWDPSLIFVMIGAISVSAPIFFLCRNKSKPLFADKFFIPTAGSVDKKLIFGSIIFGIGWGLVGFCPGPAVASLALLNGYSLIFVVFMLAGFLISRLIENMFSN